MSSVSPSLVEAAARALLEHGIGGRTEPIKPIHRFGYGSARWVAEITERDRKVAEAVLVAVGDALRLEGREAVLAEMENRAAWADHIGGRVVALAAQQSEKVRLEGAQAERERTLEVIYEVANSYQYYDLEGFATAIREALGGVHPEASDG